MERSGMFDANIVDGDYDRVYLSDFFAAYFASFIGNGYFSGNSYELQVVQNNPNSMDIIVKQGQAFINGYWYENQVDKVIAVALADGVLNRKDSVVVRLDLNTREITTEIKTGTPAINATAPDITRNSDVYELELAQINVQAGLINVKQINIIDMRLDKVKCGMVTGVVNQVNTTTFGKQIQDFINDYIIKANEDYQEIFIANINQLNTLAQGVYDDFVDFINDLKSSSTSQVNDLIEELNTLIDPNLAVDFSRRITELETKTEDTDESLQTHEDDSLIHRKIYIQSSEPTLEQNAIWIKI